MNAPIYAYYARQIVERTGIVHGCCLDIGCGGGYLGLALSTITELDFVFCDQSPEMLACAEENIVRFGCRTRARTLLGRVQAIPLAEGVIDLVVSVFFVGIKLSNGQGGVAYTPPEAVQNAGRRILRGGSGTVRGMRVASILAGELQHPFAGVIRLAALNALSAPLFESGRYDLDSGDDLSTRDALFRGRRICMVGAIIPLLRRLKELQPAEVIIIDRKSATKEEAKVGYGTFVAQEETGRALGECETAVFTGASVANGSIAELLALTPADAAVAVVGPSAGFVPDPLFARNVALVGTAMVTDIDRALHLLAEGGGGYRLFDGCVRKINLLNLPRLQRLGLMHSF